MNVRWERPRYGQFVSGFGFRADQACRERGNHSRYRRELDFPQLVRYIEKHCPGTDGIALACFKARLDGEVKTVDTAASKRRFGQAIPHRLESDCVLEIESRQDSGFAAIEVRARIVDCHGPVVGRLGSTREELQR